MNSVLRIAGMAWIVVVAGCATSSHVQEMIDASHQDYLQQSEERDASINLLKESSVASLEKAKANADSIAVLEKQVQKLLTQQDSVKGHAEASKVMSAANTVKIADLGAEVAELAESVKKTLARLSEIDQLQEGVMIRYYSAIAESAAAAAETLKADGSTATNNVPAQLDQPIEIVAPDTSAAASSTPE
jgi:hypothetical protein